MPILIFSYAQYGLKTDISINIDVNTDMVLADTDMVLSDTHMVLADTDMIEADTDMIEADTDISVSAIKYIGLSLSTIINSVFVLPCPML